MRKAYNFVATVSHDVITGDKDVHFDIVNLGDWDEAESLIKGEKYFDTLGDLSRLLVASKYGEEVILTDNLTIPSELGPIEVVDDLTISLNGYNLNFSNELNRSYLFNLKYDGTLTSQTETKITTLEITGEGKIYTVNAIIANANAKSEIIINGGYHETSGNTLYRSNGGKINILAGKFIANGNAPQILTENKFSTLSNIIVSGGSFYKWDPSKYLNPQTNFDGYSGSYIVHKQDNWYKVGKKVTVPSYDILEDITGNTDIFEYDINHDITHPNNTSTGFANKEEVIINNNGSYNIGLGSGDDTHGGRYGLSFNTCKSVVLNNVRMSMAGLYCAYCESITLNDCFFFTDLISSKGGRHCIYVATIGNSTRPYRTYMTINGGQFWIEKGQTSCIICADWNTTVTINGGEFYCFNQNGTIDNHTRVTDGSYSYSPLIATNNSQIIIKGGTFGFDITKLNVVIPEEYEVVAGTHPEDKGKIWTVQLKQ